MNKLGNWSIINATMALYIQNVLPHETK